MFIAFIPTINKKIFLKRLQYLSTTLICNYDILINTTYWKFAVINASQSCDTIVEWVIFAINKTSKYIFK